MTKREKAFVLSLTATIILPIFLWSLFSPPIIIGLIVLIMPIMIASSAFMRKQKVSKTEGVIGGIILLIMGIIIGMLAFLPIQGIRVKYFLLIPAVMAIAGGYLGRGGAREGEVKKRWYSKTSMFRISLVGFIFSLIAVFIVLFPVIMGIIGIKGAVIGQVFPGVIFFVAVPLWIISIILNAISTVIMKREEIIPEKRTKMLTIVTWCIISFLLLSLFFLIFFFFWFG